MTTNAPVARLRRIAGELGFAPGDPVCAMAFEERADPGPGRGPCLSTLRMSQLITRQLAWCGRPAAIVVRRRRVVVLVRAASSKELGLVANDLVRRVASATNRPIRAGIGPVVSGLSHVARSVADAEAALAVSAPELRVVTAEAARTRIVMARLEAIVREDEELIRGQISDLVTLDRRTGSGHALTLLTFLEHKGDIRAAAFALSVHPNTLRYRLGRVRELVALDLDDAVGRIVAHLQLRALLVGQP